MLPKELVDCNLDDIRMRLANSVIVYDGKPAYVASYQPGEGHHNICIVPPTLDHRWVDVDDPKLSCNVLGARLGLLNTSGPLMYYTRSPKRQFTQGLNCSNTAVFQLSKTRIKGKYVYRARTRTSAAAQFYPALQAFPPVDRVEYLQELGLPLKARRYIENNRIQSVLLILLSHPNSQQMWTNNYPSPHGPDGKKKGPVALSRRFFVDNTENSRILYDVNNVLNIAPIGEMVDRRVRYYDNKAYLSQSVERNIGLMPV